VVDPHVHFDTPGFEFREDFAHGSRAAISGGVTTVIDMPCTSIPSVTTVDNLKTKLNVIEKMAYCDYALWGGVSKQLMREEWWMDEMKALWGFGVVGFKTYMISGMQEFSALSTIELGQVMQHAHDINAIVGLHAEDPDEIYEREKECLKENKNTIMDYYYSRSDPAESNGILLGCHLATQAKCKLHIVHLGSGNGLDVIIRTRLMGGDISTETCPHFLEFSCDDFKKFKSILKTAPVIKTKADRKWMWQGLYDKTIDFVATDHAPCPVEDKNTGNVWTDYGGLPHVEFMLPYLFSEGYGKGKVSLARLVEITSTNAAKRFNLYPTKGSIEVGSDADLVVIDPARKWKVDAAKMKSKGKFTPFDGRKFTGSVEKTILRGKVVFDAKDGIVGDAGFGRWTKRNRV
ncbi:amidohydrolase family protein, partial [bacterium]|nr:amidohydrolase family protein [bacterium]